jgi:hypothetical protein
VELSTKEGFFNLDQSNEFFLQYFEQQGSSTWCMRPELADFIKCMKEKVVTKILKKGSTEREQAMTSWFRTRVLELGLQDKVLANDARDLFKYIKNDGKSCDIFEIFHVHVYIYIYIGNIDESNFSVQKRFG